MGQANPMALDNLDEKMNKKVMTGYLDDNLVCAHIRVVKLSPKRKVKARGRLLGLICSISYDVLMTITCMLTIYCMPICV